MMEQTSRHDDPRLTPVKGDMAAAHLRGEVAASQYIDGRTMQVAAGSSALRPERDCQAPQYTELLYGEPFVVYEDFGGWAWGQSGFDGYVGYTLREALAPDRLSPTHMVTALFAHLYAAPTVKARAQKLLPMTARLHIDDLSEDGCYAHDADSDNWVSARHIAPLDALGGDPVAVAEKFYASPYLWGGKTAAGLDCSALVQIAFSRTGVLLPRDSDLQHTACQRMGREITPDAARRGDIAFFPGHIGIMMDPETLLHANATHMAVTSDPLENVIGWFAKDSATPFFGLYRLGG